METNEAIMVGIIFALTILANLYTRYKGRGETGSLLVLERDEWDRDDHI